MTVIALLLDSNYSDNESTFIGFVLHIGVIKDVDYGCTSPADLAAAAAAIAAATTAIPAAAIAAAAVAINSVVARFLGYAGASFILRTVQITRFMAFTTVTHKR